MSFEHRIQFTRASSCKIFFRIAAQDWAGLYKCFQWLWYGTVKSRSYFHTFVGDRQLQGVASAHTKPNHTCSARIYTG